ncbi:MAG: response regulator [Deltaproteobacteria bacterium]|nr:response regulator [Deltaproteobacteria bacterium]
MLQLLFDDKYALWSDLIHRGSDRLFLATEDTPEIGSRVPLEIRAKAGGLPIRLNVEVVARRPRSRRFQAGCYIRLDGESLDKCRRFLGLEPPGAAYQRARRSARVHTEVRVRVETPAGEKRGTTRNLSSTGAFLVVPASLNPGERLQLVLELPDGEVEVEADVQWGSKNGHNAIGVRFVALSVADRTRIEAHVLRTLTLLRQGAVKGPAPVVVADDDPAIIDLLVTALSRHDFEVYEARTGPDALSLIRQLHPRVVLLDILMPGLDGVDICKTLRSDGELFAVPVIFISALEEEALERVADEAGASDFLSKPLVLADLLNMVGEYLRG